MGESRIGRIFKNIFGIFGKEEKKKDCDNHSRGFPIRKSIHFKGILTERGHTAFFMYQCNYCGKVVPFPDLNFKLVNKEERKKIIEWLKKEGYELAPDF